MTRPLHLPGGHDLFFPIGIGENHAAGGGFLQRCAQGDRCPADQPSPPVGRCKLVGRVEPRYRVRSGPAVPRSRFALRTVGEAEQEVRARAATLAPVRSRSVSIPTVRAFLDEGEVDLSLQYRAGSRRVCDAAAPSGSRTGASVPFRKIESSTPRHRTETLVNARQV